eukprot:TRINITY_DN5035_c0_g1_i1.p1 TRINITY_DN5035_c0_g1~~TRINITY_DN5035_c0_g1_i1.p1  ORF type:complete len:381 (-),score=55.57 TRINITY_DN5035_c0_g1_i1:17-1021(-)
MAVLIMGYAYFVYIVLVCLPMVQSKHQWVQGLAYIIISHILLFLWIASYVRCMTADAGTVPASYVNECKERERQKEQQERHTRWMQRETARLKESSSRLSGDDEGDDVNIDLGDRPDPVYGYLDATVPRLPPLPPGSVLQEKHELKKTHGKHGVRVCHHCKVPKPDRCHHCRICGRCILKMDHHCPWINNCVGYGNYKFFLLFLFYTCLLGQFVTATLIPAMITYDYDKDPFLHLQIFLLLACAVFFGGLLTIFLVTHMKFVFRNLSTIEQYEKKRKVIRGGNVSIYHQGIRENIEQVFGPSIPLWFLPVFNLDVDGVHWPLRPELARELDEIV